LFEVAPRVYATEAPEVSDVVAVGGRKELRRALVLLPIVAIAVVATTACGGGSSESNASVTTASTTTVAPATTRSLDDYGEEYLRIIKPANDALDEWTRKAKAYTDDTTADEIATDTEPVAAAIEEADNELLRADWPQDVSPDVKAFVTANGALIGDFRSVGSQTIFTVSDG
jgi:hypothetical protein